MKKVLFFLLFGIQSTFGQNPLNVGSLQISNDNVHNTSLNSGNVAKMDMGFDGAKGYIKFGAHTGNGYRDNIFYMSGSDGNVGVGTSNPLAKFEVNGGSILVRNSSNVDNESSIMLAHSINITTYNTFGTSIRTITQSAGNNTYGMQFFTQESYLTGQTEKLRISGNGNIGIGTIAPDEKLTVKGKIHTQEVRVDMSGPLVPDYVFKSDYKLIPLKEIEKFVKENKHLPEIPSAKEIEANGLMLAEMNMNLLKKIEELTLYMIEQEKKSEIQSKEIDSLNKKNKNYELILERIIKLENQSK